jgi:pilus assembly protein CpaB
MKPKTLILIVAAVGCGLAASYMTSRLLAERAKEEPAEVEKVAVLVAKQKIAMGTMVKNPEQYFIIKEFTKGQEPKKALTQFEELKDKRLNKPLSTEQFVTSEDLLDGKSGDLSAVLPAGMRAIAIRANLETSTGFVLPNSRVDLIVTVKRGDQDSWSRIIMQNMQVLAVDLQDVRNPDQKAVIPSVVTLAATPEEAEKLSMAQSLGEIRMVLRPFGEDQHVVTKGQRPSDIARSNTGRTAAVGEELEGSETRLPSSAGRLPDFGAPEKPGQAKPPEQPTAEQPPPVKTHVLTIENGESLTRAVYTIDHKGEVTTRDIDKQESAPRPERSTPPPTPPVPQPPARKPGS